MLQCLSTAKFTFIVNFLHPRAKKWRGGGQKQIVRADGILSPKPPGFRPPSQSAERERDAIKKEIMVLDFRRKRFEL
jgi:hypothetical protein